MKKEEKSLKELLRLVDEINKHPLQFEDGFTAEKIRALNNQRADDAAKRWRKK